MLLEQICLLPHANIHHYSETSKELHEKYKSQLEAFVEIHVVAVMGIKRWIISTFSSPWQSRNKFRFAHLA